MLRIRYAKRTDTLVTSSGEVVAIASPYGEFFGPLERIGEVSLADLKRAAGEYCDHQNVERLGLWVSAVDAQLFDESPPAAELVWISATAGGCRVHVLQTDFDPPTGEALQTLVPDMVNSLLNEHGVGPLDEVTVDLAPATQVSSVEVAFPYPLRGRTVADAHAAGTLVYDLLRDIMFGATSKRGAIDALDAGHPALLLRQPESIWLEAKSGPYRLNLEHEKLEFAKDVAAMANGAGGLIVLGFSTVRRQTQDIIDRIRTFDLNLVDINQMRDILEAWVYPQISGLSVEIIALHGRRGVAYVRVPLQESFLKPFFVVKADVGDKVTTKLVSLPTRTGDRVEFTHVASIHAAILAGRAALAMEARLAEEE